MNVRIAGWLRALRGEASSIEVAPVASGVDTLATPELHSPAPFIIASGDTQNPEAPNKSASASASVDATLTVDPSVPVDVDPQPSSSKNKKRKHKNSKGHIPPNLVKRASLDLRDGWLKRPPLELKRRKI
ncbi:UNVERIFIED_CONTAM: hypothetical protein Slati_3765800 [Sesamum latifolium]|uniref:Uncharacterized protein n=1 Tax=Sesamum latifolium TaxID=2727402 RepID=A0AAW2U7Y6_9LAMI